MAEGGQSHSLVAWVFGVILFVLGVRWFEKANIYFPSRAMTAHPGSYGLKYEELEVRASDGPVIHGWYVENKPESPVLLVSHGNAGNISNRMDKLLVFRSAGASVLLYDYRGYGRSAGSPSETGTYEDGEAAWRWLVETRKVPPERIVFYGESLGAAVAVELATRHKAGGLILDSAFTSIGDMGKTIFPFLPVRWIVRLKYDSLAKAPKVACPVLVMHSAQDDIVPYWMGRKLFEELKEPKVFLEMRGDHNEGFLTTGPPYLDAIRAFLKTRVAPGKTSQ